VEGWHLNHVCETTSLVLKVLEVVTAQNQPLYALWEKSEMSSSILVVVVTLLYQHLRAPSDSG
jgi:hypothetical protein